MKAELKNIEANKGLGDLFFGMTPEQVKAFLGDPSEIEKYDEAENEELGQVEIWHYDVLELSIGFEEVEQLALMSISVTGTQYELDGVGLIGKSIDEVSQELEKWGVLDFETEDHSDEENPNHKLIVSDYLGLIIWFDDDQASEISWSPSFEDESTIDVEA